MRNLLAGAVAGVLIVLIEARLHKVALKRLVGGGVGLFFGLASAWVVSAILGPAVGQAAGVVEVASLVALGYLGLAVGSAKGSALNLGAMELFASDSKDTTDLKILDTSVIIDGRIADVAETGFLTGTIVIPQFVLWELQLVADSADSMKRNRGRRGLDVLQRLQKTADLDIKIVENDYPRLHEVDQKLIELGKEIGGQVVTNDFNLLKLAGVHGVRVLNINELANALKPVVLPGEIMQVFILKEGKEYNQGVAYLDDGTMVVVDNARSQISKTVDVTVTSVLQTTAGKMIFGRYEADGDAERDQERRNSKTFPRAHKVQHAAGE
jgi:uncharacterized protein YacL